MLSKVISLGLAASVANASLASERQVVTYFLKQQGATTLLKEASAVSDPDSERYGDFLSFEDVVALQRPSPEHVQQVHAHLDSLGVKDRMSTVAGDKVVAVLPAKATAAPASLGAALDGVMTANTFEISPKPERSRRLAPQANPTKVRSAGDLPQCLENSQVSAKCIRGLYGLGNLSSTHPDNRQGVIVNEQFSQKDLAQFLSENGLPGQQVVKLIDGQAGSGEVEASLDTQYIIGFGPGTPTWYMYINGHAQNPFASWLTYMSNSSTIPWVQSLSVGVPENEVGNDLVERMNTEMAALGARGVTIVFASGDSGYQAAQKFGAGSPYVTAVGGIWNGELAQDSYFSVDGQTTGGFSSLDANALPDWQKSAVASYLKTEGTRPGSFNSSRRSVPDLSLFDADIQIVTGGSDSVCGGTSASAPMLSGMLSLINDALLHKKLSPLGFVNPFLYKNADAFLDITKGDNNGFAAVEGYDPASGLGTFSTTTIQTLMSKALSAKQRAADMRAARAQQVIV